MWSRYDKCLRHTLSCLKCFVVEHNKHQITTCKVFQQLNFNDKVLHSHILSQPPSWLSNHSLSPSPSSCSSSSSSSLLFLFFLFLVSLLSFILSRTSLSFGPSSLPLDHLPSKGNLANCEWKSVCGESVCWLSSTHWFSAGDQSFIYGSGPCLIGLAELQLFLVHDFASSFL